MTSGTPAYSRRRGVEDAIFAVGAWQKSITDSRYDPNAGTARLRAQQRLATAALTSASKTVEVVLDQSNGRIPETVLATMPTLDVPVMAHEIFNPNWQTDSQIHATLDAAGCTRSQTLEFGWWQLLTLRLLSDQKLPDPPAFLLDRGAPFTLPFDRASLTADNEKVSPQQCKSIDQSIRNLIRCAGGIWHRRGRWLFDAPLAAAWWRVEIADTAARGSCGQFNTKEAYEVFRSAWRTWADTAARNSTRLAAPNCAAAYVLAALKHQAQAGVLPTGQIARVLVGNLMRRTQHLSVSHISPLALADLAS